MAQRSRPKLWWYRLTQWVLGLSARVLFRIRRRGHRGIPATGPVVLLSNHQSHLDPPLIGCFCHRPLAMMARSTLFKGVIGTLIQWYDAIPIDRDGSGLGGVRETLKRLKQGSAVLMFPEGTRTPDGNLQPLKPGFCALVKRSGATVVPVGIAGAYEAWPRARKYPLPGRIALVFGEPIPPEKVAAFSDDELLAEVAKRIALCVAEAKMLR